MDWRLYSETEPTNIFTGRLWIKPSNGSAYIRLGNSWLPLASVGTAIDYGLITILINGVDKTDLIELGSLSITNILTKEVDSCGFIINDDSGSNKPVVGQEVLVFMKTSAGATPSLIFGGKIDETPQIQYAQGKYQYEVACSDYTQCLNKRMVTETYEDDTAGAIIKDIVENWCPELGCAYVEDGATVDYISFNYKYPFECIEELAGLIGYDWYVDYDKNIHFFPPGTNTAPYELTESAGSGLYSGLEISVDKSELKNRVTVRGGYALSELYTQVRSADGTQDSFQCDYTPYDTIKIYVDSGGGYAEKTLGIDNIDTTGKDFVVNVSEKLIKNLDHAVLTAGHKIKITYKYRVPIISQVDDQDSIDMMKLYEGGNGIYESPLIVDETIATKAQARARAQGELDQYSNPLVEGSFMTNQHGYRSGQLLTVNIPSRGVNAQYLIQEVSMTSLGSGRFEYEITFATLLKGLNDFLKLLYDSGRKIIEREDEILNVFKVYRPALGMTAEITNVWMDTGAAAVWSNDEETTPNRGRWNLFKWG